MDQDKSETREITTTRHTPHVLMPRTRKDPVKSLHVTTPHEFRLPTQEFVVCVCTNLWKTHPHVRWAIRCRDEDTLHFLLPPRGRSTTTE